MTSYRYGDPHTLTTDAANTAHAGRYGPTVYRHLRCPQGVGRLEHATARGRAGSAACGDLVEIDLRVEGGRVVEARFRAFGCPATIAGAAEMVERVEGTTIVEAAGLGFDVLERSLRLPNEKRECAQIAVDALHAALEETAGTGAQLVPPGEVQRRPRVVVGMSGGVDSSVAALELVRRGYDVVGVTFRLWSDPSCGVGRGCCAPEGVRRARSVAHALGAAHLALDVSAEFREEVVEHFVREYAGARTPNPCVRCNADFRFRRLWDLADRLGARHVATGHYAGVEHNPFSLRRALHRDKDQSYVLAEVEPDLLEGALFPLGDKDKDRVRSIAREAGLESWEEPESQEICFIPDDDHRRFLRERLGDRPGLIVTTAGEMVGSHAGLHNFTVGQRRGLGISLPAPHYVVALRAEERTLVVGTAKETEVTRVRVAGIVWHGIDAPAKGLVQLRSASAPVATALEDQGREVVLHLEERVRGIAPGQCAVVYEGDRVVLAGTIVEAEG